MMPSHQQLIGLLAHADPGFIAGDFATSFRSDSGPEGRTGSFWYFPGGFWEVSNDGASRHLVAPWGMRAELESGPVEEICGRGTPRRFPPYSLVLPQYSTFLGREYDDWHALTAALTNLEAPLFKGTPTVSTDTYTISTDTYTITSVDLGHTVQTLAIIRSKPNDEDLAALDEIKAGVPAAADRR